VVEREARKLRSEIATLEQELRRNKAVLSLKQASAYFDHKVTPETIREYIWFCGLPAFKRGRMYFIYRRDLLDFQIGLLGHESRKKDGIKEVVAPRHRRNLHYKRSNLVFAPDSQSKPRKPSPIPSPVKTETP
jgi:hypothetical protein